MVSSPRGRARHAALAQRLDWPAVVDAHQPQNWHQTGTSQPQKAKKSAGANLLTLHFLAPRPGLEPGTYGLTAPFRRHPTYLLHPLAPVAQGVNRRILTRLQVGRPFGTCRTMRRTCCAVDPMQMQLRNSGIPEFEQWRGFPADGYSGTYSGNSGKSGECDRVRLPPARAGLRGPMG
jgi:hypothetical protein